LLFKIKLYNVFNTETGELAVCTNNADICNTNIIDTDPVKM